MVLPPSVPTSGVTRIQFSEGTIGGAPPFLGGMSVLEHFVSFSLKWGPIYFFKILNGGNLGGGGTDLGWGARGLP